MSEERENGLFPEVLKSRWSVVIAVVIPSVVLFLVNALAFWITWEEMKLPKQHAYSVALLVTSLLPALVGLVTFCLRRTIHGLVQFALGLCCLAHLITFWCLISKALPGDTPQWMVGDSFYLIQFATMVPGLFITLWRIASLRTSFSPLKDFALSILVTAVGPGLLYGVFVCSHFFYRFSHRSQSWSATLMNMAVSVLFVAAPVFFFVGLLRCLMWLRTYLVQKSRKYRALQIAYVGAVSLVFPLAGLLLNKMIPFPADFQNPWPYSLTVVNALALMVPATGWGWVDRTTRLLRWALMPFTFYFFIVFLPFMPFSLFAILAMGTGFLILAPTLLLVVHGQQLKRDVEEAKETGASIRAFYLQSVVALLLLPAGFVLKAEYDRSVLHRTLDYYYSRDDAMDSRSPVSPGDVKRILRNVRAFKDGAEIPYLTNWYNWRVFDNLLLQEEKFKDLWWAFVDDNPPDAKIDGMFRNIFGELFGGRTRSPGNRGGWSVQRVSRKVDLTDVTTASVTTNSETYVALKLFITSREERQQAEYETLIQLPASAWVSGLKLKIGTNWVDGRIIERKAAEWVYRQIRSVRRDPAFLRYEGENLLKLSVFPIEASQTREVELTVVFPEGFADAIMIGDRRVEVSSEGLLNQQAYANGALVASRRAEPLKEPLWKEEGAFVILDCSQEQRWTEEALAKAFRRVKEELGLPIKTLLFANYDTQVAEVLESDPALLAAQCMKLKLPQRGGLDMDAALRRAAAYQALRHTKDPASWTVSKLVLLRNQVKEPPAAHVGRPTRPQAAETPRFSPKVKPPSLRAAQRWLPILSPTLSVVVASKPVAEELLCKETSNMEEAYDPRQFIPVCAGERVYWLSVLGERICILWDQPSSSPDAFEIWDVEKGQFAKPKQCLRMEPGGIWAKGAEAWRLQTRLQQQPSQEELRRDILKASWDCGVVTDVGSYIVVENSAQWKMLELKQRQTLAANSALDTVEAPAPSMVWLLAGLLLMIAAQKISRWYADRKTLG